MIFDRLVAGNTLEALRGTVGLACLAALLCGCAYHPTVYQLQDGNTVICKSYFEDVCGVHLENCLDGNSYVCQRNVGVLKSEKVSI